ncbi:integral membrane protein [Aspergillus bombycis]|uniref:Integral membrane protein n=1 Tax=Aspergillus bombycis TaxID=109264 RepID=A0A1F8AEX4_9EURO|nr:integral membrane protein [Aspergillus bombycis]OGM50217.1 integral membrane protein [Aspergillus bombycis]
MDHIEPVDGSNGPSAEAPRPASTTQPTSLQRRQRATSLRSRRPTIRLQRLPSLDNAIPQIQPAVSPDARNASTINVASPPPAKGTDEDAWQGNRRRSSSEPRPAGGLLPIHPPFPGSRQTKCIP